MKTGIPQISIGERVQAAQISPNTTNTSAVPTSLDPSPGKSTITPIDTSALDSAGANIQQQAQQGNRATSDSARKANNPANKGIQYDKPVVNAEDQSTQTTPGAIPATPQPKSKGFRESLIQQQSYNRTGGNQPAPDRDYGYNNENPNEHIGNQPQSTNITRTPITPYNPKGNVDEPKRAPIQDWETDRKGPIYKAPQRPSTPSYKTPIVKLPKLR